MSHFVDYQASIIRREEHFTPTEFAKLERCVAINIPLLTEFKANPAVQKNFCTTKLVESYIKQIRVNCGFDQM